MMILRVHLQYLAVTRLSRRARLHHSPAASPRESAGEHAARPNESCIAPPRAVSAAARCLGLDRATASRRRRVIRCGPRRITATIVWRSLARGRSAPCADAQIAVGPWRRRPHSRRDQCRAPGLLSRSAAWSRSLKSRSVNARTRRHLPAPPPSSRRRSRQPLGDHAPTRRPNKGKPPSTQDRKRPPPHAGHGIAEERP